ncbi:hypothetical protein LCGC14_3119430 [marine sediment metagenome]|uniref:RanBP2-type domain-containing protein n=1 Tax=marine sediment metagenome TaxID=412755 RepID=A0A0F8WRP5_9ZZZZ
MDNDWECSWCHTMNEFGLSECTCCGADSETWPGRYNE